MYSWTAIAVTAGADFKIKWTVDPKEKKGDDYKFITMHNTWFNFTITASNSSFHFLKLILTTTEQVSG